MKTRQSSAYFVVSTGKKLVGIGMMLALTGCATLNGGITQAQCTQGDWRAIGYQDGLMGRDASYLNRHAKHCPAATTASNQALWQQGRAQGLTRYCTPLRAYQLGREGIDYHPVCPPAQMLELLKAHDEGYYNYQREQTLNQLWHDPFEMDPFWGTRFGSRWYYPRPYARTAPNALPQYVPESMVQSDAQDNAPVTKDRRIQPK